jgi:Leucine-rich repeat (LRR) protein
MSCIDLLRNNIPVEQAQELVKIMQAKEKLTTLCGLSGEETELDFSNTRHQDKYDLCYTLDAGDAVLIANDISNMRELTSLNISNNAIGALGFKHLSEAVKGSKSLTELDVAGNCITSAMDGTGNTDMSGVVKFANAISEMGALLTLDISNNNIKQDHAVIHRILNEGIELNFYELPDTGSDY